MPSKPLRILIAWRPGKNGDEAMQYAAWLARTSKVKIRVFVALSRGWPLTSLARLSNADSWVAAETTAAKKSIYQAFKAAGIRNKMLDDDAVIVEECTSESTHIVKAAQAFEADLIVLGAQSHSPAGRYQIGSTSDALLHFSPIPLGLAPKAPKLSKNGVTRVSVSYIDTSQSHTALRKAADLAHRWDVPLRLVAFTPRGATMYPTKNGFGSSDDLMIEWREQAMAMLDRGVERTHTQYPSLPVETSIGTGHGWADAMDDIKWKKGDLLVLGSSTLGAFGRVFIGSSTNQIIRNSPAPTLITIA